MSLTNYLQAQFAEHCPAGWISQREVPVLPPRLESVLGYAPRADVLLRKQDDSKRLWIEFEISRADPMTPATTAVVKFNEYNTSPLNVPPSKSR